MIINKQNKNSIHEGGSTLPSSMSLADFASAMRQFDASGVPPERLRYAIRAHVLKIMANTVHDRELGNDIATAYIGHLSEKARQT